ncbi:hypothetical protein IW261DRAFT_1425194 [Armillaria novae-zelandiae]|uniref:Uncharacterized protein n=1 Tax=Armillaria novae-zelandiae TaxID=153914 RepID=A0AA39T8B3_9AGAR|nr:hypothetical protein IW261DRAFT_1425194 [Armillaria novae-zelandiae]
MNRPDYPTRNQYRNASGLATQIYFTTPTSASPTAPMNGVSTNPQQASRGLQTLTLFPTSATSTASRSPLGWSAPSRQTSRPCRCGRGNCRWRFFYPDRMMIAIHEFLLFPIQPQGSHTTPRKLSVSQTATFMMSQNGPEVSFLKTFSTPLYRYCEDNREQMRGFLKREPWLDVNRTESDKVVCLGCGCDVSLGSIEYDPGNWMHHRAGLSMPNALTIRWSCFWSWEVFADGGTIE